MIQVSSIENKEELLHQISKELYKDEWFIDKAILSYKAQQEKTYTFFKNNSEKELLKKYNWCERPASTNMSLCNFTDNGTICGWMSESLAEEHGLEQITLNDFIYQFIQPIIIENIQFKDKIKAKIEPRLKELDEQMKKEWKEYGNSREYQDMEDEWNFLQSLLEKE